MYALPTDKKQKIWDCYCEEEKLRQKYQAEVEPLQKRVEELSSTISEQNAELTKWHQMALTLLDFMQPRIEKMIEDRLKDYKSEVQSMIDEGFDDYRESEYQSSLGLDA